MGFTEISGVWGIAGTMRRSFLLPLVLAPAFLTLAACGSGNPAEHAAKAKGAFAVDDYATARVEALAALEGDGRNVDLLALLIRSQLLMGDGDGAQATLQRLVDAGQGGAEMTRWKAEAALLRGQPNQAIDWLGSDDSASAWRIRAASHYALKNYPAAAEAYRRGMAGKPDALLARDYARMLIEAQDYAGAARALEVMQRVSPDRLDTRLVAGDLALRQGRRDDAARIFAEAAKAHPRRIEPLLARAAVADIAGKVDEAAGYVERAAAIAPGDSRVIEMTVQIAAEKGEWETVRKTLAPMEADLDPRSPNGLKYAEAMLALGKPEQARAIFSKALLLSPQNPYARIMLAEAQLATGDGAGALRTMRPLSDSVMAGERELDLALRAAKAAHDPVAADLQARLQSAGYRAARLAVTAATEAVRRQDWAAAIASLQSVQGHENDAEMMKLLAFASSNAARHDDAIAQADRALFLSPRNPDMIHMAGLARLNAGRDREAMMRLLKQAAEADPQNRLFRADLARGGAAAR